MLDLFFQVFEMSATASLVILVVLVLRLCLRKAPKVYSYALWSVVLFRLLCPLSIESGLSILPERSSPTPAEIARYEAIEAGEEYLAAYHAVGDTLNGGLDFIDVKVKQEYVEAVQDGAQNGTIALSHGEVWKLLLGSIWPVGVVIMLLHGLWSMWKLKRGLLGAVPLRENIYLAKTVPTPFTLGLFRPAIFLPDGLGEYEQSYIIAHEQYHIRRGDHIIKILAFIALCLHWFNPLVWLAFHLAGKDMEMSCDEAVVKRFGSGIRADYSQSLLTLATGRRRVAATPLAFGEGDTKGRIQNILNWKKPKVWVSVIAVLACIVGIFVCAMDPVVPKEEVSEPPTDTETPVETGDWTQVHPMELTHRVWSFDDLQPGQTLYFDEELVLADTDPAVICQTTYGDPSLTLEFGLIKENGTEIAHTMENGNHRSIFNFTTSGRYQPFIRNTDTQAAYGTIYLGLSSEESYFQESTLLEPATQFDNVQRVMINSNVDVPEESKTELIALLNEVEETWQDTPMPADFSLPRESGSTIRILCEDGSWYLIEIWRDERDIVGYQTSLTWKDRNFQVIGTWIMDDEFNRKYHAWLETCYIRIGLAGRDEEALTDYGKTLRKYTGNISQVQQIHHGVMEHHRSDKSDENFCCASIVVLGNEAGTRMHPVTGGDLATMQYYLWVLYQEYQFTENGLVEVGGAHIPTVITMTENPGGSWSVLDYWEPRNGSYYAEDIKAIFPGDSANDALNSQKYIMAQKRDCYEQAVSYANVSANVTMDVDSVISGLLDKICSSPTESSNPKDYAADHPIEYRELKYYGRYTEEYCRRQLQDGSTGLREQIMEMLLGELNP